MADAPVIYWGMDTLDIILRRNLGQVLTPELIAGILHAAGPPELEAALPTLAVPADPQIPPWAARWDTESRYLVIDDHTRVAQWVAERAGCSAHAWAGYVGIGVEQAGELLGGVVLESFTGSNANIHVAGVGRHWLNRALLFTVFDYAFNQLGLRRLTGYVQANNTNALRFDTHLGFVQEAIIRDGAPSGDVIVLAMYPETCRYLRRPAHGQ